MARFHSFNQERAKEARGERGESGGGLGSGGGPLGCAELALRRWRVRTRLIHSCSGGEPSRKRLGKWAHARHPPRPGGPRFSRPSSPSLSLPPSLSFHSTVRGLSCALPRAGRRAAAQRRLPTPLSRAWEDAAGLASPFGPTIRLTDNALFFFTLCFHPLPACVLGGAGGSTFGLATGVARAGAHESGERREEKKKDTPQRPPPCRSRKTGRLSSRWPTTRW